MERIQLELLFKFMFDEFASEQSGGDRGMWQPKTKKRLLVMSRQNGLISVQSHVACIQLPVVV